MKGQAGKHVLASRPQQVPREQERTWYAIVSSLYVEGRGRPDRKYTSRQSCEVDLVMVLPMGSDSTFLEEVTGDTSGQADLEGRLWSQFSK